MDDRQVPQRITDYLSSGGLWNPELANHDEVRHMLIDARDVIEIMQREIDKLNAGWNMCEKVRRYEADLRFTNDAAEKS